MDIYRAKRYLKVQKLIKKSFRQIVEQNWIHLERDTQGLIKPISVDVARDSRSTSRYVEVFW